jgi:phosphoserine phosphatase
MCCLRSSLVFFIACLILVLCLGNTGYAASEDNLLASWQGDVRDKLIAYILDVSKPGHPNYIPEIDRIAVFDMDGTLLTEKPIYFVFDVAIHYMEEYYNELSSKGPRHKALCAAARKRDYKYLIKNAVDTFVLPFEGKTYAYYKQYCLKVFETAINPKLKRPFKELVYQPMVELIDLLHARGFRVFVVSGSLQFCIMAISKKYLHVEANRCIGSMVQSRAERKDNAIVFRRGKISPPINLKEGKAIRIRLRTGKTPVLAFGNSMGDEWMLRFPATSRYRHMSFVIDHDDPREFVYRKERLIELSRKQNWTVVSMKNHFKWIYAKSN